MTTAVLYGLAFTIPAIIYFAMEPRKSTREAQIRSAITLFAVAVFWAAAVYDYSQGRARVLLLVCSLVLMIAAGLILRKGRLGPRL
ncbi:hypothetical protein MCHIJ_47760 [Mycolicibacterium chitae]|nr:hypothetical protein MCHIJ_47760 [Mycolicibacterium chitae]